MKRSNLPAFLSLFFSLWGMTAFYNASAQKGAHIDWSKDTVSSTTANNAQRNFANALNGTGKKASTTITLPVDKLKDIMDACSAAGISSVKLMIVSIRAEDVAQYEKHNPGMSDNDKKEIVGRQLVVIRVPRRTFAGPSGSGILLPKNSALMISLLASGFAPIAPEIAGMPVGSEDLYFSFGSICPPPNSCD